MCHTLIYLFLVTLGLCCCTQAFFSCSERGDSSLWCTGFSLWWLLLLWGTCSRCVGFSSCDIWALICSRHMESSWTRNRTQVLCIGRWIPSHCATREVPYSLLYPVPSAAGLNILLQCFCVLLSFLLLSFLLNASRLWTRNVSFIFHIPSDQSNIYGNSINIHEINEIRCFDFIYKNNKLSYTFCITLIKTSVLTTCDTHRYFLFFFILKNRIILVSKINLGSQLYTETHWTTGSRGRDLNGRSKNLIGALGLLPERCIYALN